jgi:hypothetical protein
MNFPQMALIEQTFDSKCVKDIPATVRSELERVRIGSKVRPGQQVAITAGSRGIANMAIIIKTVVEFIRECGAEPFIFPAMGSHAGALAEGQKALLSTLDITDESMDCPIYSTMEVVEIGSSPDGLPVFLDAQAHKANHIMVINRVKPHTKFKGPIESGMIKMMALGMGKQKGADLYHKAFVKFGMGRVIETVGQVVLEKCPILCGLGVVENGYDETAIIRAVTPNELMTEEKKLLVEARRRMARIPFSDIDLLIIDEMGKNISGTGMDTNITGVNRDIIGTFNSESRTKRLFVRDLTVETEGNAVGIGYADFTTTRLVNKINRIKTYINCITGISPEKAAIPIYFDTDRECVEAAINCLGMIRPEEVRIVHIRNTLVLDKLNVSRAYESDIAGHKGLKRISKWVPVAFGHDENIISPFTNPKSA